MLPPKPPLSPATISRRGSIRVQGRSEATAVKRWCENIWRAAPLMVKRYREDAMLEAAERADQLLYEVDVAGAEAWHRILNTIERLQAMAPAEGEKVH